MDVFIFLQRASGGHFHILGSYRLIDFGKMTIYQVFIGCTRGILVIDVDFGKMTIY